MLKAIAIYTDRSRDNGSEKIYYHVTEEFSINHVNCFGVTFRSKGSSIRSSTSFHVHQELFVCRFGMKEFLHIGQQRISCESCESSLN